MSSVGVGSFHGQTFRKFCQFLRPLLSNAIHGVGVSGVPDLAELSAPQAVESNVLAPQPMDATPPSQNAKSVTGPTPSAIPQSKEKQQGGEAITNGGMTSYLVYC